MAEKSLRSSVIDLNPTKDFSSYSKDSHFSTLSKDCTVIDDLASAKYYKNILMDTSNTPAGVGHLVKDYSIRDIAQQINAEPIRTTITSCKDSKSFSREAAAVVLSPPPRDYVRPAVSRVYTTEPLSSPDPRFGSDSITVNICWDGPDIKLVVCPTDYLAGYLISG